MHHHRSNYSCKCLFSFPFHFFIFSVIIFIFHESEHLINISIIDSSYDSFYRLQSSDAWGKYYSMGWSAATIYQCIAIQAFCVVSTRDRREAWVQWLQCRSSSAADGPDILLSLPLHWWNLRFVVDQYPEETDLSYPRLRQTLWGCTAAYCTELNFRLLEQLGWFFNHELWREWNSTAEDTLGVPVKSTGERQMTSVYTALSVKLMLRGFLRFLLVKFCIVFFPLHLAPPVPVSSHFYNWSLMDLIFCIVGQTRLSSAAQLHYVHYSLCACVCVCVWGWGLCTRAVVV